MSRRFNQKDAEKQSRGIVVPDDLEALEREVYELTGVAPPATAPGTVGEHFPPSVLTRLAR